MHSQILAINVAVAAPLTPISGNPNFPYIKQKFKITFKNTALVLIIVGTFKIATDLELYVITKDIPLKIYEIHAIDRVTTIQDVLKHNIE